jgi:RNA polymerase subunit RPABC4/transcription elongation factor Spt4
MKKDKESNKPDKLKICPKCLSVMQPATKEYDECPTCGIRQFKIDLEW